MISEVGNVTRLNSEVLEGLCLRIDDLVEEFSLNLVSRHGMPPESFVENASHGLQYSLGDIDVSPLLEDFLINHLRNLGHSILLGAVKLESLTSGRVIVEHLFQTCTDVDGLGILESATTVILGG